MKGLNKLCIMVAVVLLVLAVVAGFWIAKSQGSAIIRPHIIFILGDDMGFNDVSFHGSDQVPTPNIDALGYNGVILNRHYVQPVCTPSRSALLTGKYPIHTGMQGPPLAPSERRGLPLNETTMAQHLKGLGYATHIVGKWHLGYFNLAYTPLNRGFDSHLGFWNGATSYFDHLVQGSFVPSPGYDFRANFSVAWDYQGKYTTDIFTEEAELLIENHDTNEPLFLYLPHGAIHGGNQGKILEADQETINKLRHIMDPNRRTVAAMITKLDESVGRVVSALQKKDMLKNSVVVFMTDNGAPLSKFDIMHNWGSNHPFRGEKATLWEGGVRTPACIWSPFIKNPSRVSYDLMHISDWLPTFYSLAGGKLEQLGNDLDGQDMWPTISQGVNSPRNEVLINIDERDKYGAVVARVNSTGESTLFKLIVGKDLYQHTNDFNPLQVTSMTPAYNTDTVLSSNVNIALKQLGTELNSSAILQLRNEATIVCQPVHQNISTCETYCLFNLDDDLCEQVDLSQSLPQVLDNMKSLYESYLNTLVPQPLTIFDQAADPLRFNYTWSAWMSD